jgi:uncharacterized protein (TIGR03435 family)
MIRLLLLLSSLGIAQQTPLRTFEVASVKLHPPTGEDRVGGTIFPDGTVTGTFQTLCDLVRSAYDLRPDQLSGGPSWACSDHYDFVAKAPFSSPTEEEVHQMMRSMLAERFQLALTRDSKEVPAYALVVSAKGSKPSEARPTRNRLRKSPTAGSHSPELDYRRCPSSSVPSLAARF